MGLSRKEKYQELRDSLDEDTTASVAASVSSSPFPRVYGDIDRYQHESRAIHSYQKEEAVAPKRSLPKSEVMNDLLGEVKQYNIDNGNRLDDDTQINILKTLDNTSDQKRRSRHIVEMEEEESSGTTMRISRSLSGTNEELSAYMPGQKLTRINPIQSRSTRSKTFENFEQLAADLVADEPVDEDDQPIIGFEEEPAAQQEAQPEAQTKPSLLSRIKKMAAAVPEEEPEEENEPQPEPEEKPVRKRSQKKSKPSFLFDEPEEENEPAVVEQTVSQVQNEEKIHNKALTMQNVLIAVLVVLLLCSLGLSIFILRKIGII
jgi:hypothetical protein